jgi:hypothetical protein
MESTDNDPVLVAVVRRVVNQMGLKVPTWCTRWELLAHIVSWSTVLLQRQPEITPASDKKFRFARRDIKFDPVKTSATVHISEHRQEDPKYTFRSEVLKSMLQLMNIDILRVVEQQACVLAAVTAVCEVHSLIPKGKDYVLATVETDELYDEDGVQLEYGVLTYRFCCKEALWHMLEMRRQGERKRTRDGEMVVPPLLCETAVNELRDPSIAAQAEKFFMQFYKIWRFEYETGPCSIPALTTFWASKSPFAEAHEFHTRTCAESGTKITLFDRAVAHNIFMSLGHEPTVADARRALESKTGIPIEYGVIKMNDVVMSNADTLPEGSIIRRESHLLTEADEILIIQGRACPKRLDTAAPCCVEEPVLLSRGARAKEIAAYHQGVESIAETQTGSWFRYEKCGHFYDAKCVPDRGESICPCCKQRGYTYGNINTCA